MTQKPMSYGCLISNIKLLDGLALKKRTSGPVNAYLTPGPGIYILMLLHMYIAHEQGQKTPWGQMLMPTKSPYYFANLLQVLKQSL